MLSNEEISSFEDLLRTATTQEEIDYVEAEIDAAMREAAPPLPEDWMVRPRLQDIAALFNVELRTVEKWRASGMPGERGTWPLLPIIDWVFAKGLRESGDSENQERLRKAKAEIEEIKLAELRGEMVPLADLHEWLVRLLSRLRELQEAYKRGGHDVPHNMMADTLAGFAGELDKLAEGEVL